MPAALANMLPLPCSFGTPYDTTADANMPHSLGNVVSVDFKRKRAATSAQLGNDAPAPSEWQELASERLASLSLLRDGWDGPLSVAPAPESLARARRILDLAFERARFPAVPAAVPSGDGAVHLEWWLFDARFEFIIEADGSLEAWGLDRTTDHEVAASSTDAIELLAKWSSRLTADKLVAEA